MSFQGNNDTLKTEFHILAFSASTLGRLLLFCGILLAYFLVISGNLLILTLVNLVSQLQNPMYFFLCNLSLLDILYISTTIPKLLYILYTNDHRMTFVACMFQLFFFISFADSESFLLTAMAFDRYVAICLPLHYSRIMSKNICVLLAFFAWFVGAVNALILTLSVKKLSFPKVNEITNFFCDLKALIHISSSNTGNLSSFVTVDILLVAAFPLLLILTSYMRIILNVLKIQSSFGRQKMFSNCSSHFIVVVLYYGPPLFLYIQSSQYQDKLLSVIFVTVVPMLNPLVYSLRNQDIIRAVKKTINQQKKNIQT
uniref:Olfactory receptor n=1 Tax=Pyxicephalus adspersus TaxID=30357 RepID=A0AAV3B599_PYXAD|nr:TPA: hypothetical protein GDO54_006216 [Pyxicephalus adspersus]